ncbi:hypothetical protein SLA2020_246640 [Shorea laevis]
MELNRAELALAVTIACVTIKREPQGHGAFTCERDETEAVSNELLVEKGGVDLDFHQIDGDSQDLRHHDAAQGIGHRGLGVPQLELEVVAFHVPDFDPWESLVRCSLHFQGSLLWGN